MYKSYSELQLLLSFEERFRYLKLHGKAGEETFGLERYLNQVLYQSPEWKSVRRKVIDRDNGCDLGIEGREIAKGDILVVHHMNPITVNDILERRENVFDINNLICCSKMTHNAIHYGDESLMILDISERRPGDTCPWKQLA